MGSFYRGGRLHSAETIHLQASATLSGTSETPLASQAGVPAADTFSVVSTSPDDAPYDEGTPEVPAVPEVCVITLAGTPQAPVTGAADEWTCALDGEGGPADGDTFTVTVGGTPYVGTYHSPDEPTVLFGEISAAIALDGTYTGALVGSGPMDYVVTAVAEGPGVTVSCSTTSSGITFGPAVHSTVGATEVLGSVASVTDGTHTYTAAYVTGSIENLASDLAAEIDGQDGYSADATGADITVSGPTGYVLTDESANAVSATFDITEAGSALVPATGSNGLGARSLLVEYIDADGRAARETLTLSGATPVTSTGTAKFIQRITVASAGANGTAGTLTCKIGTDAFLSISAGAVQSASTAYLVPADRQLRLTGLLATASDSCRVRVRASFDPETGLSFNGPQLAVVDAVVSPNPAQVELPYACGPFPPGSYVHVTAEGANTVKVIANLDGFLEPVGAR